MSGIKNVLSSFAIPCARFDFDVEMLVQAGTLPAQDGHPMSPGDEFELQGEATTNPEREQGPEGGQKREHADDGMAVAQETLCFLGVLEF